MMRAILGSLLLVVTGVGASGCLQEGTKECASGIVCPASQACDEARNTCVAQEQIDACHLGNGDALEDGTPCVTVSIEEDGFCSAGVCLRTGCGNAVVETGEACDDGNIESGDGCRADCQSNETCGNGRIDAEIGEQCDDGNTEGDDACEVTCQRPACGDGVHNPSVESCDDGNLAGGDGCSATCELEACGDDKVDLGEECDDGNTDGNDTCEADCTRPRCGDEMLNLADGEECDDGDNDGGDGCDAQCRIEACGNGRRDEGEMCDAGPAGDDACRADCTLRSCGDGILDSERFEACDAGAANSNEPDAPCRMNCQLPRCGDEVVDTGELCDDGNVAGGDGCAADCKSTEVCGNLVIDVGEECDKGADGDILCRGAIDGDVLGCTLRRCGDEIIDAKLYEACDDGAANSDAPDAACRLNCQAQRCGDGVVDPLDLEECDDGGNELGDGCDGSCKVEACGNGRIDLGEDCDDGNGDDADLCRNDCSRPRCGDAIVDGAQFEQCDAGAANSDLPDAACRPDCQLPACGDGVIDGDAGEACDDNNNISGDGCDGVCRVEVCGNGRIDANEDCDDGDADDGDLCRNDCSRPRCGDGIADAQLGEGCDAGALNSNAPDAPCRTSCQPLRCGDHVLDVGAGEACDDGNNDSGDACNGSCQVEVCGNGRVDVGEDCDDGNGNDGDLCRNDCSRPRCGDGVRDPQLFEQCDAGAGNSNAPNAACRLSCQVPRCGDSVRDTARGEVCDDGNNTAGDHCSGDCLSNETCGNGIVDSLVGEECDNSSPNCRNCRLPACGDGVVDTGEECDAGEGNTWSEDAACRPGCLVPWCGDGVKDVRAGELCDDANFELNDGCRPDCLSEERCGDGVIDEYLGEECDDPGPDHNGLCTECRLMPQCGDGHVDPGTKETCDDGNWLNHDGCSSACQLEDAGYVVASSTSGPGARLGAALSVDLRRRRIVLTGGQLKDGAISDEVWAFAEGGWTLLPTRLPFPVAAHAQAYDPSRDVLMLCGGRDEGGRARGECVYFDGARWQKGFAVKPRMGASLVWDHARQRFVLAGGVDDGGAAVTSVTAGDLRGGAIVEFDGPKAAYATMVYDPRREVVVLSGGEADGKLLIDTWELAGATWRQVADAPVERSGAAAYYNAISQKMVVVGGSDRHGLLDEIATWDGTTWVELTGLPVRPTVRANASAAFDPDRGEALLFGGKDDVGLLDSTWIQAGVSSWSELTPQFPESRTRHVLAHDWKRGRTVLWGGRRDDDGAYLGETWGAGAGRLAGGEVGGCEPRSARGRGRRLSSAGGGHPRGRWFPRDGQQQGHRRNLGLERHHLVRRADAAGPPVRPGDGDRRRRRVRVRRV
jgi:cysteine-rich repeat protein